MTKPTAIIYAAGRATRLGAAYAHQPKVLLEFGGLSLLERHVIRLAEVGVARTVVVTGHFRERITAEFPRLTRRYGVQLVERFNPDFGEGSVVSMLVSLPDIEASTDTGVLLMDGDVLYDSRMLPRLLQSPQPTALLVDFGYTATDDDPVLVPIRNGRPFEFQKQWQGTADRVGESVGFFTVAPSDAVALAAETRRRAAGRGRLDSLDEVLRTLVREGRFGFEDITGLPWTEIDYPGDVRFARETILPALVDAPTGATIRP